MTAFQTPHKPGRSQRAWRAGALARPRSAAPSPVCKAVIGQSESRCPRSCQSDSAPLFPPSSRRECARCSPVIHVRGLCRVVRDPAGDPDPVPNLFMISPAAEGKPAQRNIAKSTGRGASSTGWTQMMGTKWTVSIWATSYRWWVCVWTHASIRWRGRGVFSLCLSSFLSYKEDIFWPTPSVSWSQCVGTHPRMVHLSNSSCASHFAL